MLRPLNLIVYNYLFLLLFVQQIQHNINMLFEYDILLIQYF